LRFDSLTPGKYCSASDHGESVRIIFFGCGLEINERYFAGRQDGRRVAGSAERIASAWA
jgi:hypothetical protein